MWASPPGPCPPRLVLGGMRCAQPFHIFFFCFLLKKSYYNDLRTLQFFTRFLNKYYSFLFKF
jgi:hypothetical protein